MTERLRIGTRGSALAVAQTRLVADAQNADLVKERLAQGGVDVVTFTSGSTVENFLKALETEDAAGLLQHAAVAAIGPVTRAAAEARGLKTAIEAPEASVESLAEAVLNYFAGK